MKGYIFSLDALIASSLVISVAGFLITQSGAEIDSINYESTKYQENILEISSKQSYQDYNQSTSIKWDESIISQEKTVLEEVYHQHYSGNSSIPQKICDNYFNFDNYSLYFVNKTSRSKVCGFLSINQSQTLVVSETFVSDVRVNGTFLGSKKAILVNDN